MRRAVVVLTIVAAAIFIGVAVEEITYANQHPEDTALAEVIAWGASGGAVLAVAVGLLAYSQGRR